jgi:hypothetical protein
MTSLLSHFTAPAEPEEPPVTTPRPRYTAAPWWAAVPGLDPAIPVDDWEVAARYTALACSVHVYGLGAVYKPAMLSFGKKAAPANLRLRAWLTGVTTPENAERRRFALRLAAGEAPGLEVDDLLRLAQDFADALGPG